jgi:hypothetical protein
MQPTRILALLAFAAAPLAAQAADVTLTFEGATSFQSIANFYNGGTDAAGASGTNSGISFTEASLALQNDVLGPYFSNAPTPGTVMFAQDSSAVMNVANGFAGGLKFSYSAQNGGLDLVKIYSGLNATGTLLASVSLFPNGQLACTDSPFCRFDLTSVQFAGIAKSVSFGGDANFVAYDNISITAVPEPTSYAMLAAGLCLMGLMVNKRR